MKWTNMNWLAGAALVAGSIGLASPVFALDTTSSQYLGYYIPPTPSNLEDETAYVNFLRLQGTGTTTKTSFTGSPPVPSTGTDYTFYRSGNACPVGGCPVALLPSEEDKTQVGDQGPFTVDLGTGGWDYIVGKYDNENGGGIVWYVGGLTGQQSLPPTFTNPTGRTTGLSHFTLFDGEGTTPPQRIPEPASLALVGLGLAGLALTRRRKQR